MSGFTKEYVVKKLTAKKMDLEALIEKDEAEAEHLKAIDLAKAIRELNAWADHMEPLIRLAREAETAKDVARFDVANSVSAPGLHSEEMTRTAIEGGSERRYYRLSESDAVRRLRSSNQELVSVDRAISVAEAYTGDEFSLSALDKLGIRRHL